MIGIVVAPLHVLQGAKISWKQGAKLWLLRQLKLFTMAKFCAPKKRLEIKSNTPVLVTVKPIKAKRTVKKSSLYVIEKLKVEPLRTGRKTSKNIYRPRNAFDIRVANQEY